MKRVKSTLALAAVLLVTTGSFKIARAHLESSTPLVVNQQRPPVNGRPKDRKPAGTRAVETPSHQDYFHRSTIPAIALGVIVGILCWGLVQRQLRSYLYRSPQKSSLVKGKQLHIRAMTMQRLLDLPECFLVLRLPYSNKTEASFSQACDR